MFSASFSAHSSRSIFNRNSNFFNERNFIFFISRGELTTAVPSLKSDDSLNVDDMQEDAPCDDSHHRAIG